MDEHAREAASVIANLLCATLAEAERQGRHLYIWEREGIEWLREQWKKDPETQINMWTADRYVSNTKFDMLRDKASPFGQSENNKAAGQ